MVGLPPSGYRITAHDGHLASCQSKVAFITSDGYTRDPMIPSPLSGSAHLACCMGGEASGGARVRAASAAVSAAASLVDEEVVGRVRLAP